MPPRPRDLYQLTQLAARYLPGLPGTIGQQVRQVQDAIARRGDESVRIERTRRKLERKRVWAGRWATAWALISTIALMIAVFGFLGVIDSGEDGLEASITGLAIALVTGTLAVRSTRRMVLLKRAAREFDRQHPRQAVTATAMPSSSSEAYRPMRKLAEAEDALATLLNQLTAAGTVPAESVEQARATGAEAASALRGVARQLMAVELAREHAPEDDQSELLAGVRMLRAQLDEGLEGYRGLVAAAGRVVAASSAGGPSQDLSDATDHLAGLAHALRELSTQPGS
jgi:hypothetical protein